jgi:hypothetical protein
MRRQHLEPPLRLFKRHAGFEFVTIDPQRLDRSRLDGRDRAFQ